jgi:hypothetical protein
MMDGLREIAAALDLESREFSPSFGQTKAIAPGGDDGLL